ncbi:MULTISPECIES: orotidine-5'-phosphate decarboxylase [Campylobacter]|uniref:orotidine-5'-phosphate decarboxylase n=1 Tax=Campylobacter TaxID=194 RepID=UPI0023F0AE0D|nr:MULTISPECIES: orotidine-5'-phosphate decarboxylase [Campylobacter]MCI6641178.1 orotidine-5'-phosphate decarboxylase [Campylobacter sp.]MDD7421940.1 orotidine-5'-phosphate decarboxylase [Campylobacter hominis]MDY3117495.1 orotidine-5'-phosphate decarboxylase [Campylobacter hominis]
MKLCVALDLASRDENLAIARALKGLDIWLKVGLRSYLRDGANFLNELKKIDDFKIFVDLKIYDIPNTMADAAEVISNIGADMINLHASSGLRAMSEVMNRLANLREKPLVLAVSALTSFSDDEFYEVYNQNIDEAVLKMSQNAKNAGLDGMVCSVFESLAIKKECGTDFITLTPGIRPFKENSDDQKRVANIVMAKQNLSDFIVVGRPIYKSFNPRETVEKILQEIL